jgi:hypothetical protein
MPYCCRCGVEVDRGVAACPLCEAPIPCFDDLPATDEPREQRYPPQEQPGPVRASGQQVRLSIWATLSAIFVISMLVVLAANLIETGWRVTWSSFALGSIGLAWVVSTIILVIFRPPWLVLLCTWAPVAGFLAFVDAFDGGGMRWFLPVGLPVASASFLAFEVSTVLWTLWKDRGANQLAILLLLLTPACFAIDLSISAYFGEPRLSWSYVVAGVLVPLAGFLFVYHYALRRVLPLDRIFHV